MKAFVKGVESRAIALASEKSKEVTGAHLDPETIRNFKWFGIDSHIKLAFDPTKCKTFMLDKDGNITRVSDIDKIDRGSVIYPIMSIRRLWFADQFGIVLTEGLAIRAPAESPFDFILESGKTFDTNRLLDKVNLEEDLDFDRKLYINPKHNSPGYYFNCPKFELPKMKCPFGLNLDDVSSPYGYIQLDISDGSVTTFLEQLDDIVATKTYDQYKNWFGGNKKMTPRFERYASHFISKSQRPQMERQDQDQSVCGRKQHTAFY